MKIKNLFFLVVLILFSACKKEETNITNIETGVWRITQFEYTDCDSPNSNLSFVEDDTDCTIKMVELEETSIENCLDGPITFVDNNYILFLEILPDSSFPTEVIAQAEYTIDGNILTLCETPSDCFNQKIEFTANMLTISSLDTGQG